MKNRKEKTGAVGGSQGGQNFGRTFFHPPSGVSIAGMENLNANGAGPTLIDHNQLMNTQFNTAGGNQIPTTMKIPQN